MERGIGGKKIGDKTAGAGGALDCSKQSKMVWGLGRQRKNAGEGRPATDCNWDQKQTINGDECRISKASKGGTRN